MVVTGGLGVAGTITTTGFKLTTGAAAGYILTSDASGNATWAVNGYSDLRLKTNIKNITHSLGKIIQLNGVYFDWIDKERGTGNQVGVIAQEVEKVLPQLVNVDQNGYKYVNYPALIAPLIESVKELNLQNQELSKQNKTFKKQLKDLQKEITEIADLKTLVNSLLERVARLES